MIEIHPDNVPLSVREDGSIRVGDTGVSLYLIIEAWQNGASPEYIAKQIFETLNLADTFAAIAYYLRHKDELEQYFQMQDEKATRAREWLDNDPALQTRRRDLLERLVEKLQREEACK
jgi:uncharacterized protein (DUF433 family)